MKKHVVMAALGDFYRKIPTGLSALPFIYNNIPNFQEKLKSKSWNCHSPLIDPTATKENIINKLNEVFNSCGAEDWVMFYYTGHASKYFMNSNPDSPTKTYCVTYCERLRYDFQPNISAFLSQDDYTEIVKSFQSKVPNGHLITILDCCFAYGMINEFTTQSPNHTVIAAASASSKAYYNTNSAFFIAYSQVWDLPFDQLQNNLNQIFTKQELPGHCIIKTASRFENQTI